MRRAPSTIILVAPTILPKLSDTKIRQQIWIHIFNDKQDTHELKRYDSNNNHRRKIKDNCGEISVFST